VVAKVVMSQVEVEAAVVAKTRMRTISAFSTTCSHRWRRN